MQSLLKAVVAWGMLAVLLDGLQAQAIFGTVKTTAGVPIEGVLVRGVRNAPLQIITTTTDFSGGYVLGSGLNGTYTVQAIESGYTFTPASTNVNVSGSSVQVHFTSPSTLPAATTVGATNVTALSALLQGTVNPNGGATTAYFEYGLTTTYGSVSTPINAGSGSVVVPVNVSVAGLSRATPYHFRMVATNSHGNRTGNNFTFTTDTGIPDVSTRAPTDGGATSMRLNGLVNPHGASAIAWFEVGLTTNYGTLTSTQSVGSGTAPVSFSHVITGLSPGTYHGRAVAATSFGTNFGADVVFTPGFSNINAGLTDYLFISRSAAAWGDYNNDNRLDVLRSGVNSSQVWRNQGSNLFQLVSSGLLPNLTDAVVAWADFDNDGRLDVYLSGNGATGNVSQVWRNTGTSFSNMNVGLPGMFNSSVAAGDYNNDGRLDLLLAGYSEEGPLTQIWRNTGGGFANVNAGFPGVYNSSVAWGDLDNDGRLDVALAGYTLTNFIAQIWRNTGSGFTNINAGLPGVTDAALAWGDYDQDGRIDLCLTGTTNFQPSGAIAQIWRNTGSGFSNIYAGLTGLYKGSVAWGDYDNDGRLDLLLTGTSNHHAYLLASQIWRNTGNGFVDIGAGLSGIWQGSASWGDYDNDGRLDILLCGMTNNAGVITRIWRNHLGPTNTVPGAPTGLHLAVSNTSATLKWTAAMDGQTPSASLTYNLRIGTTPGGADISSPMAGADGWRRLPQMGGAQLGLNAALENYALGTTYYWSVQAVDSALAGSPFASESTFKILPVSVPVGSPSVIPGDLNGDGVVDHAELAAVLNHLNGNGTVSSTDLALVVSNYWNNSAPGLTNVALANQTNFQFWLSNLTNLNLHVEVSTNLSSWQLLGPAQLFHQVNDPGATNTNRFYRLVAP